ncbi:SIS domain-containing protein [Lactobacillus sp. YT155]|uniref:SIS domain-containing protein n=1 Tax=Lactobacillus sp. YT155 TaxID=3060955 RepID=UPI0026601270|nr:SIS domain-containing protein [Lactobacillus sp. YT155]MDO1604672.1 SIS domain-containing protein [Lactobacillus sp. YT155]
MLKFDEKKLLDNLQGGLELRPQINEVVDRVHNEGYSNVCWLGIGGTYASSMQAVVHMKERSAIETFYENAAVFLTTGNKRVTDKTLVVISSVTGSTQEVVDAVKKCNEIGARVFGFIDKADAPLAEMCDYTISYPLNEQMKFFMVADRLMNLNGEYDDYEEYYSQLDKNFAKDLVEVYKKADGFAEKFALKHHEDEMHYFVGAGNQWGATYSYAMCYWEEQHWLKTKSIEAQEFFHGMFEIVERDTPVTIHVTEDSQRALSQRVVDFIPQICANYTVIDAKDYDMPGISEKHRGNISPFIIHAVNDRIDVHIENLNRHPMEIRRYYRQLEY